MPSLVQELLELKQQLDVFIENATEPSIVEALKNLEASANVAGRAWSGSWLGHQANIYYEKLKVPPPGVHFSIEWGSGSDKWREYDPDYIKTKIEEKVDQTIVDHALELAKEGEDLFNSKKNEVISILEAGKLRYRDAFLDRLLTQTNELYIPSVNQLIRNSRPEMVASRDRLASSQGFWTPPHIFILARIFYVRNCVNGLQQLSKIVNHTVAHLRRIEREPNSIPSTGSKIFIGHGRSTVWRDLKDFIQDRLKLEWDEFNRVPAAGHTIISRLTQMLDEASLAFIVMTAEDEQLDGSLQARMNVIHEAGLFQGRLGFNKAIILLEEGCTEFSNIHGLVQIRFPPGNIAAKFEIIREILEREGLLSS